MFYIKENLNGTTSIGGCNREGYPDQTAGIAIGRVMKQEKRKKKEVKKDVRIDRKLKNGQKV